MTELASTSAVATFAEHEHRELRQGLDHVRDVACHLDEHVVARLSSQVLGVVEWFDSTLAPHIAWEDTWLYPEVELRTGVSWLSDVARLDHERIRAAADQLREDWAWLADARPSHRIAEVRCHLFALLALVQSHLDRETELVLPLLAGSGPPPAPAFSGS